MLEPGVVIWGVGGVLPAFEGFLPDLPLFFDRT